MTTRIKQLKKRFLEIEKEINNPETIKNQKRYSKLSSEYSDLKEILERAKKFEQAKKQIQENEKIIKESSDPELKKLAEEENQKLQKTKAELEKQLELDLLPKDPNDHKDAIIEIRAGTGGDEAALFAADLFRLYSRYAEKKGYKVELISSSKIGIGGFKEVIFNIRSKDAYKHLKSARGVPGVQRIPDTQKRGRVHTSAATVAVLPEAEAVDIEIKPEDLKVDAFRSSGPGGQSVNTTDSAVRVTHLPSNTIVTCQDEKSQLKNKEKALKVLRSRLLAEKEEAERKKRGDQRRSQIGTGDRSEKIRTYNFPQDRLTDHRIKLTLHNLDSIMQGEIDPLINALIKEDQKAKLEKQTK
ncbi:peptide chain release factor 1 [Patescibacteria group bacterium]|nr:MAG: peptide chain release factor 1 [Patescibacteria group bacterium]